MQLDEFIEQLNLEVFMAASSSCPFSISGSSTAFSTVPSRIVPAREHPDYEMLKKAFEDSIGFFDKAKTTIRALRAQGQPFKKHAGIGFLLTSPTEKGAYLGTKVFTSTFLNSILVTDPEIASEVLKHHRFEEGPDRMFTLSTSFGVVEQVLGPDSLLTTSESQYKLLRKFSESFFTYRTVKTKYFEKLTAHSSRLVDIWGEFNRTGQVINITKDIKDLSRTHIVDNILGSESTGIEFAQAVDNLVTIAQKRILGYPEFVHQTEFESACSVIAATVDDFLSHGREDSLVLQMKNATNSEGSPLFTQNEIISMCKLMLLAGQDTTATVLIALIYELGKQPLRQSELYEDFLKYDRNLTEFARGSTVLGRYIDEILRLYPTVFTISRKTTQEIIIADRCYVPEGWGIDIQNVYMNRDIRRWPEDPHLFNPDRDRKGNHQGKFVFGGSKNPCLGRHFAVQSIRVFMSQLISKYRWEVKNETDVDFAARLTIYFLEDIKISLIEHS